jgi:hypothetical protein
VTNSNCEFWQYPDLWKAWPRSPSWWQKNGECLWLSLLQTKTLQFFRVTHHSHNLLGGQKQQLPTVFSESTDRPWKLIGKWQVENL